MEDRIGINADSLAIDGRLPLLEECLARFGECGFGHVEIPIHGLDCLIDGRLRPSRLAEAKRILSAYPFGYTVHAPDRLNLADGADPEAHARALRSSLDFAAEIGAGILVFHGSSWQGEAGSAAHFREAEIERLGLLAEHAARRGVRLAAENLFRQSKHESGYRLDPRELAALVGAVDSPSLGICLDFGHAFIASREEGFPLREALLACLPRLLHLHVHDNFGKPGIPGAAALDLLFRGAGDLHLPPGWGGIPYGELLPLLADSYRGVYLLEIRPRFADSYREAREGLEALLARARGGSA